MSMSREDLEALSLAVHSGQLTGAWLRDLLRLARAEAREEWLNRPVAEPARREHHVTPKAQRPRCGARRRDGRPCEALAVWDQGQDRPRNGRCRMHGGLSTGARTAEGRERIREAQRRRWERWRASASGARS